MNRKRYNRGAKKILSFVMVFAMLFSMTPALSMADSGAADVAVKVTDITDTTAKVTITNNKTYKYPSGYCLIKKANEQAPTAEEVKGSGQDNQVADLDFIQGNKKEISKEFENLNPGTEYTAYAIVYYGEKHGEPEAYSSVVSATFTTKGGGSTVSDVEVKVTDITDTTAKVTITNNKTYKYPSGYCLIKKANEQAPTAEEVKGSGQDNQVADLDFIQGNKKEISKEFENLNPGTEYTAYAIVYYGEKHGEPEAYSSVASATFTTKEAETGEDILELSYKKDSETQITTEKFKDYKKAFEKVNALGVDISEVKIMLLQDFAAKDAEKDFEGAINIRRSCVLDLAGHRLELKTGDKHYGIRIVGESTYVTIQDSSENKSGHIENMVGSGVTVCIGNSAVIAKPEEKTGNLTITSGKISSKGAEFGNIIYASEDTSFIMEGGALNGAVYSFGRVDIRGGTIEGEYKGAMIQVRGAGSLNMSGGKISNNIENIIPEVTSVVTVNKAYKQESGRKNFNMTAGVLSARKAPVLYINSSAEDESKGPKLSIGGESKLIAEDNSVICFDLNETEKPKSAELKIDGNATLEGKRILEIIKIENENSTKNLKFRIDDSVKLKYSEAVPFLPNSSYITYPEGKVIATEANTNGYYEFVTAKDVKQKITIGGAEKEWGYQYLEELEREIQGAESIYDMKNSDGKYNADLWTAFKKAYEAALPIPQNKNANQNEINYFKNELGKTRSDMTSSAENSVDVSKLADGTYDVDIEMRLWNKAGLSMANEAVDHTAKLEVKDGVGKLTLQMKPISILKYWGSLMQLWAFDGKNPAEAYANSAKSEKGQKTEANYLKYHNVPAAGGTPTPIDGKPAEAPSLDNSIRPKTLEITLPYMGASNDYNKIYCYVAVDMMRALAGGPDGDQPVILYIKYSTLKPVDVKPAIVTEVDALTIPKNVREDIKINLAGSEDMSDWSISAKSDDENIATADYEAGKITVKGVEKGETDITVKAVKAGEADIVKKLHIKISELNDAVKAVTHTESSEKTATTEVSGELLMHSGGENVKVENNKIIINADSSAGNGIETVLVNMSKKVLNAIAAESKSLIIKSCIGDMEFNAKAVEQINQAGDGVTINLKKVKDGNQGIESITSVDFKITKKANGNEVIKFDKDGSVLISTQMDGLLTDDVVYAYEIKNNKKVEKIWAIRSNDTVKWNVKNFGKWELSTKDFKTEGNTEPEKPGVDPGSQKGTWSVPIYVKNLATGKASMANGAFSNYAVAEVTDTGVTYTITLQGMRLQGLKGHLLNLWYYKDYAQKTKEEATYTTYKDTGLNGDVETFPRTATFTMQGKPADDVYIRVNVDAMNAAAIGAGQQDALLMFNWRDAERGSGKADSYNNGMDSGTVTEKPKEEKPLTPEEIKKAEAEADEVLAKAKITDVSKHWAKKSIAYVVEKNLFKGVSTATGKDGKTVNNFEPESNMTRSMVVTVLHRLAGTPAVTANAGMADVKSGTWYENAVNWAVSQKIVNGVGENRFAPDRPITREAFVTMLYNYAKTNNPKMNKMGDISKFKDASSVSSWAKDALQWAVGMGFLTGNDKGELSPAKSITRAEVASIFERYLKTVEAEKAKIEKEKAEKAKSDKK